jgi:host factor-I protein
MAPLVLRARSIYNVCMAPTLSKRRSLKTPPPDETGQEALYLRSLSDRQVNVQIKLRDGETVRGWIEYFDDVMLRLTREGKPNLFIYKHQIRTISEVGRMAPRRAKTAGLETNGVVPDEEAS